MSEKVATGVLSGVVKVSGFFTSSIVNSKVGKKFFGLLPGEIVLASLDGFSMLFFLICLAFFNNILYVHTLGWKFSKMAMSIFPLYSQICIFLLLEV